MRKKFRSSVAIVSVICLLVSAVSCGKKEKAADNIFRYNEVSAINTLDPAFARNQAMIWIANQLFDGLVVLDKNLEVQPAIAKSWTISDSGKRYTFNLRQDVWFHENPCFGNKKTRQVVAEDFSYSLSRLTEDGLASPGAWLMKPVDYFMAVDDTTFVVQLSEPFPPFLGMLSMSYCSVLPFEAFADAKDDETAGDLDFGRNPVGTGPFTFTTWKESNKLVLTKNNEYWQTDAQGNSLPYLDGVAVSFIPDKQSAFLKFLLAEVDFISGLDASYKDELLSFDGQLQDKYAEDYQLLRSPYLNTEYLGFAMEDSLPGLSAEQFKEVRQAVNYGFNRADMMRYLRNSVGIPATAGIIPPGLPKNAAVEYGYEFNPKKAKDLLASAGFPGGVGLPELKLYTNASYLDLCEYLQSALQELGVNLNVEVLPPSTLREMMSTGKASMFRASWIADYADAENYLSLFYGANRAPAGPNYTRFSNDLYDAWYNEALSSTDINKRNLLYARMDSLVMSEAAIVPLYYDEAVRFCKKGISGLDPNPLNLLDLRRVKK